MNNEVAQILDNPAPNQAAPQAPITEALPEKPAAQEKVSGKLEMLIRREQQALQRERFAKQKEAEVESKLQQLLEREKKIQEFEGAKGNSKKAMELLGLNYDELTKSHLQDGEIPPEVHIKKIEEKFDAFKSAKEQEDKQRAEETKRAAEAQEHKAIADFKGEINTYLKDNAARYELIAFEGQEELVFDVIDEHYNRTLNPETGVGNVMTKAEAADKVEAFLEQKEIKRKELAKVKTLWGSVPKNTVQNAAKPEAVINKPLKTLTNQLSARATPSKEANRFLTDEERVQKALQYHSNLLKR